MKTARVIAAIAAFLLSSAYVTAAESQNAPVLRAHDKFSISGASPSVKAPVANVTAKGARLGDSPLIKAGKISASVAGNSPIEYKNKKIGIKLPEEPKISVGPVGAAKRPFSESAGPVSGVDVKPYPALGRNPLLRGGLNVYSAKKLNFSLIEKRFKGLQEGEGEEIREKLMEMVSSEKYKMVLVRAVYDTSGKPVAQYSELMEGGYKVTDNRAPTWEGGELAIEIKLKRGVVVHIFIECGNPAIQIPPAVPKKPEAPPTVPVPQLPGVPPMREPPKLTAKNKFTIQLDADLWAGAGIYESMRPRKGINNRGYFYWWRAHLLPFGYQFSDDTSVHFGAYAFGAGGAGKSGDYRYSWNELFYGPSVKLYLPHRDIGLDVGGGILYNRGFEKLYRSHQWEKAMEVNFHYNDYSRRDNGHKLFVKTEINVQGRMAWGHPVHNHSWDGKPLPPKAWNNNFVDVNALIHLYDLELNEHFTLTPGFNISIGREFGTQTNYVQFGPALTLNSHNEQLAILYPLNVKFRGKGGDQWHWVSLSVSADAVVKAWYRAHTTQVPGSMTPDCYKGSVIKRQIRKGKFNASAGSPQLEAGGNRVEPVPAACNGEMVSKGSVLLKARKPLK